MKVETRGHKPIYKNDQDRKEANKKTKTKYMVNKQWICPVYNKDYKLAGKTQHLKTKKHHNNASKTA